MKLEILKKKIKALQKEINKKIPDLNSGGCIWFGFYFSKALADIGIPYKVYGFNYEKIGRTYGSFESVNHIMVYIDGIGFIDGYKTVDKYEARVKRHIKLNVLKLATGYQWNTYYDTDYNNDLEEIINTYIK